MPTKMSNGGKNSLNPAKNLSERSELCLSQKSPGPPKIPNRQKSLAAKNPLASPQNGKPKICAKNPHNYQSEQSEDW